MPDTIDIPGIGKEKKTTVYIVAGVFVVVIGVAYYRSRQTATAIPAAGIDPATGYAYGSAEDAQSLATQSAYERPAGDGTGNASTSTGAPGSYVNNSEWSQAAESYLINTVGLDPGAVSAAIGRYITGDPVDPADQSYIQQAIAAVGLPPVAGNNGYPPAINQIPATVMPPVTTPPPVSVPPPAQVNIGGGSYTPGPTGSNQGLLEGAKGTGPIGSTIGVNGNAVNSLFHGMPYNANQAPPKGQMLYAFVNDKGQWQLLQAAPGYVPKDAKHVTVLSGSLG